MPKKKEKNPLLLDQQTRPKPQTLDPPEDKTQLDTIKDNLADDLRPSINDSIEQDESMSSLNNPETSLLDALADDDLEHANSEQNSPEQAREDEATKAVQGLAEALQEEEARKKA